MTPAPSTPPSPFSGLVTAIEGRATGLTGDVRDIDLTVPGLGDNRQLTDQLLASQGVSFEGALYFSPEGSLPGFNPFASRYGVVGLQNGVASAPASITISFARPVTAVAFNLFAQRIDPERLGPSQRYEAPRFSAFDGDIEVGAFTSDRVQDPERLPPFPGAPPSLLWWGFEGGLITSVRIDAPLFTESRVPDFPLALYLANLRVIDWAEPEIVVPPASVPEPTAVGLLAIGLVGLALARRQRR